MIVVDVETTGLYPHKHSIASIGAIDSSNIQNQFYDECRIWDGAEISPFALEVNGFTEEDLYDETKPTLGTLINNFLEWASGIDNKILAGENPRFDYSFLESSAQLSDIPFSLNHRTFDLHTVAYSHMMKQGETPPLSDGISKLSGDKIMQYVGLQPEPKPHNALTGAKYEAEAFSRLLSGGNLLPEFADFEIPDYL